MRGASIFCFASIFVFPKINPEQLAQLFARVRKQGLLVCADMTLPKRGERLPEMTPAFAQLDYLFANEAEAGAVTEESDPVRMADRLISAGARHVIIKLGANGCLLADQTGLRVRVPACPDTHCIDTTGAGDTFAAGFFAGLLDGRDFVDCARFANAAASVSVEAVGRLDRRAQHGTGFAAVSHSISTVNFQFIHTFLMQYAILVAVTHMLKKNRERRYI